VPTNWNWPRDGDTVTDPDADPDADDPGETDPGDDADARPGTEADADARPGTDPDAERDPASASDPDAERDPASASDPDADPAPGVDPGSGADADPERDSTSASDLDRDSAPASDDGTTVPVSDTTAGTEAAVAAETATGDDGEPAYRAELTVTSYEALRQLFEALSDDLVAPDERRVACRLAESDDVDWPCTVVFELDEVEWRGFSTEHPEQARVLEPHLRPVGGE
jgi:hypothetical protein